MIIRCLISLLAGALFGLGLAIAQMTNPQKVLAFLDVAGNWDPSLVMVMGAAVLITALGFRMVLRGPAPLLDTRFHLPTMTRPDARLLLGAALFGVGWGLSGYCPGPALATVLAGNHEAWVFVPAMLVGGLLHRRSQR